MWSPRAEDRLLWLETGPRGGCELLSSATRAGLNVRVRRGHTGLDIFREGRCVAGYLSPGQPGQEGEEGRSRRRGEGGGVTSTRRPCSTDRD